jgi:type II secretory pathway component PulJ
MTILSINKKEYDEHKTLVKTIEQVAARTTVDGIKAESQRILRKLQESLGPQAKEELDYGEQILIAKRILFFWAMGEPVGATAFRPPLEEVEEISKALGNLVEGAFERERILEDYREHFGTDGQDVVAEILSRQTAAANRDVPLINRFLEDLFQKLLETDVDLTYWDVAQYLGQMESDPSDPVKGGARATTATTATTASVSRATRTGGARDIASADSLLLIYFGGTPNESSTKKVSESKLARTSKLQRLGKTLKDGLERAGAYRRGASMKQANLVLSDLQEADTEALSKVALERCRRAAQSMEDVAFRQGSFKRMIATLRYFEKRPAIREAKAASNIAAAAGDKSIGFESKSDALNRVVRKSMSDFFGLFSCKGPRLVEDQNCVDAALSAMASTQIKEERLGRELERALGVTRRHLKRASLMRSSLEDGDAAHWVRSPTREYSNSIKTGKRCLLRMCAWKH